jgi:hypothetical protein
MQSLWHPYDRRLVRGIAGANWILVGFSFLHFLMFAGHRAASTASQTFSKFFTINSLIRHPLFDSTEQFNIHTGLGLSSGVTTPFWGNKVTPILGD